jgi:hypothetical protein
MRLESGINVTGKRVLLHHELVRGLETGFVIIQPSSFTLR